MPNRREFIAGGVAFVGCSLLGGAHAQGGSLRREVLVSGKRVKTIDVHAHVAIPEAMALAGMKVPQQSLVMGEERQTNPFMRCQSPEIIQSVSTRLAGDTTPVAVLGAVRAAKDAF